MMVNQKLLKNTAYFNCDKCTYTTCKKSSYTKHLMTNKHKLVIEGNHKLPKVAKMYECDCGKIYKHLSGLSRHKPDCLSANNKLSNKSETMEPCQMCSTDIILELIRQNQEFKDLLVEQSKQAQEAHSTAIETQLEIQQQMLELASESKIVNNHNHNNNNTINNKFNLSFFLNEQCKNAMDLTDFLNTIEVRVEDVTNMGRFGFAEGITRIFMKALNDLDVYERPIHCSDIKREMMYIKDNGIWEKDSDMKHHMKRAIKCISFKNIRKLADWRDANPGWTVLHSQLEEDYLHITSESMGGLSTEDDDKLYHKIIRKVANEVAIDKNMM